MEKWGFGLSRKEVLTIVGEYVTKNNIPNPFKNNIPGEDWFLKFKKRHNLSIKKPEALEYARKKNTDPFVISEYFELLKKTLESLNLRSSPGQIWNMDETSFCSDPSKTKVVGERGAASTRITAGPGKSNTSVLFAAAANGTKAPPLIIYKGKNVWDTWIADESMEYPGTTYAATENGWMETTVFTNYFIKSFIPNLGPARPVVVIYDGHASHFDIEMIEESIKNDITIIKLPPHSSHLLQPLDLAVFKSVKVSWDELLVKWQRKNLGKTLPKSKIAEMVGQVWNKADPNLFIEGFKKGGIYPYNPNIIPDEKYDPEQLKRWKVSKSKNIQTITPDSPVASTSRQEEDIEIEERNMPSCSKNADNNTVSFDESNTSEGGKNSNKKLSFEELLLSTCRESVMNNSKKNRKRASLGAEIVTSDEVRKRIKENVKNKKKDAPTQKKIAPKKN